MNDLLTILQGDVLERLRELTDNSVQCVVTSPPYWGLRDYGVDGQIGLEPTPAEFIAKMVAVFAEVRRVLRRDGTCWVNMGDSYATAGSSAKEAAQRQHSTRYNNGNATGNGCTTWGSRAQPRAKTTGHYKPKDKLLMPHRLAIALCDDGWWIRSDIVWHKPNPMPESCRDRPTTAHEYLFLLTKSARYFYDADAIRTPPSEALLQQVEEGYTGEATKDYAAAGVQDASDVKSRIIANKRKRMKTPAGWDTEPGQHGSVHRDGRTHPTREERKAGARRGSSNEERLNELRNTVQGGNARSVWSINTQGYPGAHFATFPLELPRRCILAGTRPGDLVLDPFGGSGTTAQAALELGRRAALIELNPAYVELIRDRLRKVQIGLAL
ncbi:MAG: Prophage PssSM-02 DNA methylase N-4/N-6 [Puniceicoccaceae bacterium 5H]|nr:MAG: Prophage PssSM-02 DNA methylase N-4/N-6 [Puniceicoccaceae bacterium 5H]